MLTDVDLLLAGEVYGYTKREGVITCLRNWKLRPAGIFEDPKFPGLHEKNKNKKQNNNMNNCVILLSVFVERNN